MSATNDVYNKGQMWPYNACVATISILLWINNIISEMAYPNNSINSTTRLKKSGLRYFCQHETQWKIVSLLFSAFLIQQSQLVISSYSWLVWQTHVVELFPSDRSACSIISRMEATMMLRRKSSHMYIYHMKSQISFSDRS